MTQTNTSNQETAENVLAVDDPRRGLAAALVAAHRAIQRATDPSSDHLGAPTPCADFTVEDLIEHMLFIAGRVATIGNGGHFSEAPDERVGSAFAESFAERMVDVHAAWSDPAKLGQTFEVPWGEAPGVALMLAYTAEYAAHSWDLTRAIGAAVEIDDTVLAGAAEAVRFIPPDGRDDDAIPFGPVVEAPAGASNLEQIVTWVGRSLAWSPTDG